MEISNLDKLREVKASLLQRSGEVASSGVVDFQVLEMLRGGESVVRFGLCNVGVMM